MHNNEFSVIGQQTHDAATEAHRHGHSMEKPGSVQRKTGSSIVRGRSCAERNSITAARLTLSAHA